jgi:hypothetical protein
MNEYKITTTIGDLFVTASSRKHAATVAREDPRFDGTQIRKVTRHKLRHRDACKNQYIAGLKCIPSKFLSFNAQQL